MSYEKKFHFARVEKIPPQKKSSVHLFSFFLVTLVISAVHLRMSFPPPFPSYFHFHAFSSSVLTLTVRFTVENETEPNQIMILSAVTVSSDVSIFLTLDFVWFMVQWFTNVF